MASATRTSVGSCSDAGQAEEVGQHDLMSLFSPDDRKQLDEIKDWLWQDREAHLALTRLSSPKRAIRACLRSHPRTVL